MPELVCWPKYLSMNKLLQLFSPLNSILWRKKSFFLVGNMLIIWHFLKKKIWWKLLLWKFCFEGLFYFCFSKSSFNVHCFDILIILFFKFEVYMWKRDAHNKIKLKQYKKKVNLTRHSGACLLSQMLKGLKQKDHLSSL